MWLECHNDCLRIDPCLLSEGQLCQAEIKLEIAFRPRVLHFVKGIVIVGATYLRFPASNRERILRDKPTTGWKLSSCCARPRNFN